MIEWKNFHLKSQATSDLNFQVVLRETGDFQFRYGAMTAPTQSQADGGSATVGWQYPGSTIGKTFSLNAPIAGGLRGKGFAGIATVPVNEPGLTLTPMAPTTYTLKALNPHSSASESRFVMVHPKVALNTATITTTGELYANTNITIRWTAENASSVSVIDDLGALRCTASASQLASGSCVVTETTPGQRIYTVEARGEMQHNVASRTLTANVYAGPLSIDSFFASILTVTPGAPTALTWATTGTQPGVTLTLEGNQVPVDTTGKNVAADSVTVNPAVNTSYVLTLREPDLGAMPGRVRSAQRSVAVSTMRLDTATASPLQVVPGAPVTVTWTSQDADNVFFQGVANAAITEVPQNVAPFVSIANTPGAQLANPNAGGNYDIHTFNIDFTRIGLGDTSGSFVFPFDGVARNAVRVLADGALSFNTATSTVGSNVALPPTGANAATAWELFPFWDDLQYGPTGQAYGTVGALWYRLDTPATGARSLTIEWSGYQFRNTPSANLNFQVVLYEDGLWEFRYGTMTSAGTTASTNQSAADGGSATIGWQLPGLNSFQQVRFNSAWPGGLSNRTFRFDRRHGANDSTQLTVNETGTIRVCAVSLAATDCKDVPVTVVQTGDLLISEIMAAPLNDPTDEWFELRNVAPYAIDLAGFTITSGPSESLPIPASPSLMLQPGQAALFASRTGSTGSALPTVEYGSALTFDQSGSDEIALSLSGYPVDKVAWNNTWFTTAGKSRSLDPIFLNRSQTDNDAVANWCMPTTEYETGSFGSPLVHGFGCKAGVAYDIVPHAGAEFIDIAASGADIAVANAACGYQNTTTGGTAIGFPMPWFSTNVSTMYVSSEGVISFISLFQCWPANSTTVSSSGPNSLIAAFWDDLTPGPGSSVKTELVSRNGHQVRVVQWTNFMVAATSGSITFEMQLWDNGDIVTAYKNITVSQNVFRGAYQGSGATVALVEDQSGSNGRVFTGDKRVVYDGMSILIDKR